ncbi:hypothetical protein LINPERHAP1_LOCUS36445 [Linum perenne]
MLSNGTLAF